MYFVIRARKNYLKQKFIPNYKLLTQILYKRTLINNQIKAKEVRLVDETGKQLGILPKEKALQKARERSLDLIQVTEKVEPPVCKLMDYGKYLYNLKKKEKGAKHHKAGELKGIRLGFGISDHDLEVRAKQAEKFLNKGSKVRIEMQLKGRQKSKALEGFAKEKIKRFIQILENLVQIKIERELKREARGLTMIISKA